MNRNFTLLSIILFFLLFSEIALLAQEKKESTTNTTQFPQGDAFKNAKIIYRLTPGINNTWGYQIFVDNKITIIQPTPPGLPGNNGFATKKGAEDVAKLVIVKMKKGEMPPTITIEEMKKIKAI